MFDSVDRRFRSLVAVSGFVVLGGLRSALPRLAEAKPCRKLCKEAIAACHATAINARRLGSC